METIKIIKSFINLIESESNKKKGDGYLSVRAWETLPDLAKEIMTLSDEQVYQICSRILKWCQRYPQVKIALERTKSSLELLDEDEALIIRNPNLMNWEGKCPQEYQELAQKNIRLLRNRLSSGSYINNSSILVMLN